MTRNEIIQRILRTLEQAVPPNAAPSGPAKQSDEPDDEEIIIAELMSRLPEGEIKTCDDFKHLGVECCETCHNFYPHYEMSLIDLESGGEAWVCDNVRDAIKLEARNTQKHPNSETY